MMFRVPSPAKLNLFLHIVGRRENGYHNLQSIFQLIDLYDWLKFECLPINDISIQGLGKVHQTDNLIFKALELLKPHAQHLTGLRINVEKNIPMGAGLGGGSSNAGTTLLTVNYLWQCGLNIEQLANYGEQLGADVPFFVYGQNAWVEGIGEKITPIELSKNDYIILKPDCFISTQALFAEKSLTRDTPIYTFDDYHTQPQCFFNNFEPIVCQLYPEVKNALEYLKQFGQAKLTGTGSCVFAIIDTQLFDVQQILNNAPCQGYVVHSLNCSPVHQLLGLSTSGKALGCDPSIY